MRKTSEEFNSEIMIKNIWMLCKEEPAVEELPYWETINRYLERLEPENLQEAIHCLCRRLLQIGHMISQCMEAWERIWKKVKQSLEQKHRRLLESMKETPRGEHKDRLST